ncbi:uncharacterized protein LOC143583489 [Bidens hawaiensis]|uniref:uncharacterized protein LOC143583489 n=1 Tax=Bidens hawaiensis TaxID=980011 RepID=UPI00404B6A62
MPKYAKFLKYVLSNKWKLEELSHVILNEECSAIHQNKLPKKMTDPGGFCIPSFLGNLFVSNALADLEANITLMPYTVFSKLGLGETTSNRMSIHLVDRSVKYPRGIVENMLVKIDNFVFQVDFVILNMYEENFVPLILGRPFLTIARALIDVCIGKLTLRVEVKEVTFDIGKSMKHPQYTDDSAYFLDMYESIVSCQLRKTIEKEACDTQLIKEKTHVVNTENQVVEEEESNFEETIEEVIRDLEPKAKPSIEDPPTFELKEIPKHLEYVFCEGKSQLPVIISSDLSSDEKVILLEVLKSHKKVIAWKIMDIKGINLSFFTHKILMEEDFKPVVQHQKRLNPNMQDVMKKKVLKLLDSGLIYPISDSPWVSPA